MSILWQIFTLIIGFIILVKGADFLVDGASGIARKLHVPEIVIGMTIIAFGTSAPELSVALNAFASGNTDLTLGDIIGCAISNILLLLGLAAVIRPVKIDKTTQKREIPFYVVAIVIFAALVLTAYFTDGNISRIGGLILLALFGVFLSFTISTLRKKMRLTPSKNESKKVKNTKMWLSVIMTLGGLIGVVLGSNIVINNATEIATAFGISERIIAMTIIAMGTSLPELMATIAAAKKNEQGLLIGNAIGSNVFNICLALGLPITMYGALNVMNFRIFDLVVMVVAAIALFVYTRKDNKITQKEGVVMLAMFVAYYAIMLITM